MDMAIVTGKVLSDPQFVSNSGKDRCVFTMVVESRKEGGATMISVVGSAEPELTQRCRTMLDKGDTVTCLGEFGWHKSKLKMRVREIDLPDVVVCGT